MHEAIKQFVKKNSVGRNRRVANKEISAKVYTNICREFIFGFVFTVKIIGHTMYERINVFVALFILFF